MRFVQRLTVAVGSTLASPSTGRIRLIKGTITNIEIEFRPGCAWYVYVVIHDRILQIAPSNPEQAFRADDEIMSFTMNYPMIDAPYDLHLIGWSTGATYSHIITFRIDVDTTEGTDRDVLLGLMTEAFKPFGAKV